MDALTLITVLTVITCSVYVTHAATTSIELQHLGYVSIQTQCESVGQMMANPADECSYLVCDYGHHRRNSRDELLTRRMSCAPGTSVKKHFRSDKNSTRSPCVMSPGKCNAVYRVRASTPAPTYISTPAVGTHPVHHRANTHPMRPPQRRPPHGRSLNSIRSSQKPNKDLTRNPGQVLHRMQIAWSRIQAQMHLDEHRSSFKSHTRRGHSLEHHMGELQSLWGQVREMVNVMMREKITALSSGARKEDRKRNRVLDGLKTLWMSMWQRIRELDLLEVKYSGQVEPLGEISSQEDADSGQGVEITGRDYQNKRSARGDMDEGARRDDKEKGANRVQREGAASMGSPHSGTVQGESRSMDQRPTGTVNNIPYYEDIIPVQSHEEDPSRPAVDVVDERRQHIPVHIEEEWMLKSGDVKEKTAHGRSEQHQIPRLGEPEMHHKPEEREEYNTLPIQDTVFNKPGAKQRHPYRGLGTYHVSEKREQQQGQPRRDTEDYHRSEVEQNHQRLSVREPAVHHMLNEEQEHHMPPVANIRAHYVQDGEQEHYRPPVGNTGVYHIPNMEHEQREPSSEETRVYYQRPAMEDKHQRHPSEEMQGYHILDKEQGQHELSIRETRVYHEPHGEHEYHTSPLVETTVYYRPEEKHSSHHPPRHETGPNQYRPGSTQEQQSPTIMNNRVHYIPALEHQGPPIAEHQRPTISETEDQRPFMILGRRAYPLDPGDGFESPQVHAVKHWEQQVKEETEHHQPEQHNRYLTIPHTQHDIVDDEEIPPKWHGQHTLPHERIYKEGKSPTRWAYEEPATERKYEEGQPDQRSGRGHEFHTQKSENSSHDERISNGPYPEEFHPTGYHTPQYHPLSPSQHSDNKDHGPYQEAGTPGPYQPPAEIRMIVEQNSPTYKSNQDDQGHPPPPPLETVNEYADISLIPTGFGSHAPLNSLWSEMEGILGQMMIDNKDELQNVPTDEEEREAKEGTKHRDRREKHEPSALDHSNDVHRRPAYGGARKAGSGRGPTLLGHTTDIPLVPATPDTSMIPSPTIFPNTKKQFEVLRKHALASFDKKYSRAQHEWRKMNQLVGKK